MDQNKTSKNTLNKISVILGDSYDTDVFSGVIWNQKKVLKCDWQMSPALGGHLDGWLWCQLKCKWCFQEMCSIAQCDTKWEPVLNCI